MGKPLDTIIPTKTGRLKFPSWVKPLLGGGENEELQAFRKWRRGFVVWKKKWML